jgi:hypothetical protein
MKANRILLAALKRIVAETYLPIVNGYKLKSLDNYKWALLDPEGNEIVAKFVHMYHYKKDPPGVLSLLHPEDLPQNLRGKGLGVTSYLALAKHYGKIRSDESLTDDGEKVWNRLVLDHGAYVISTDIEYKTKEEMIKRLEITYDNVDPNVFYDPDTYFNRFELRG